MDFQGDADGGVQTVQVIELFVFQEGVDSSVDQFYRSFHEGLVAGAADACREGRTAVVLRESGEVLVEFSLILVRVGNRRLQVVRDDDLRRSAVEVEGILARMDEIFLLLAHHGFHEGKLGAGQDSDKHFHGDLLSRFPVHEVQAIPGEVHIHSVAGLVLEVCHGGGLDEVGLEDAVESAPGIAVREFLLVLLEDLELRHPLFPEQAGVLRHSRLGLVIALGLGFVPGRVFFEKGKEGRFVHRQDLFDGFPALIEGVDVLLHGVP